MSSAENVLDAMQSLRRTKVLSRRKDFNFAKKEKADNLAVCVAICSGCIGSIMAKFLFLWWAICIRFKTEEIGRLNRCHISVG